MTPRDWQPKRGGIPPIDWVCLLMALLGLALMAALQAPWRGCG